MWESVVKYVTWRWSDRFCTVKGSCDTLNFDLSVVCRSWRLGCTWLSNHHVTFPASSQHFLSWCFQPHELAAGKDPEPQNPRTPEHRTPEPQNPRTPEPQNHMADRVEGNTHTTCFIAFHGAATQTPLKVNLRLYKGYVLRKHRPFLIIASVQRWDVCAGICSFLLN